MKQKIFFFFFLMQAMSSFGASSHSSMQTLSERPRIYLIEDFLSHVECDYIIAKAKSSLAPSTVVDERSTKGTGKTHSARTSQGMFLPTRHSDPVLRNIESRIADLTQIPMENGEGIQVLYYEIGGEYRPHYDYFDPASPGGQIHFNRGGQRVATMIMYLHTSEEGGETIFPRVNVKVKPIKGRAVLFYNCLPDGKEDPMSLHGGAPVIKGEKWIATKWLRSGVFH